MSHFVVTYNIDDATNRQDFVNAFESVLQKFGLGKESSNQSTYFGFVTYNPPAFVTALFNAVNRLPWDINDEVTIYYPKPADIGRHFLKQEGNDFLHHNLIYS